MKEIDVKSKNCKDTGKNIYNSKIFLKEEFKLSKSSSKVL